jgi:hypothetical protein
MGEERAGMQESEGLVAPESRRLPSGEDESPDPMNAASGRQARPPFDFSRRDLGVIVLPQSDR